MKLTRFSNSQKDVNLPISLLQSIPLYQADIELSNSSALTIVNARTDELINKPERERQKKKAMIPADLSE